jgi:CRP/FNR family transcriptional regulator
MPLKVVPQRDRKLHRLIKKGDTRPLKKGETLSELSQRGGKVCLVRSGHLRLTRTGAEGAERTMAVSGPWELAGEEGALTGVPRQTTAVAGEKSLVTLLDGEAVARALRTAPKTLEAYLRAKEEELALARCMGGTRQSGGSARRLSTLLLNLAGRLGRGEESGIRIPVRLTHQVMADLTGCHRSTVTTLLNDWIYQEILRDEDGQIRILDREALEEVWKA